MKIRPGEMEAFFKGLRQSAFAMAEQQHLAKVVAAALSGAVSSTASTRRSQQTIDDLAPFQVASEVVAFSDPDKCGAVGTDWLQLPP